MKATVAEAVDPEIAMRAARTLTKKYKTEPGEAAVKIVDSIVKRRGRLVVGSGAAYVDFIARFYPSSYWNYLRQSLQGNLRYGSLIGWGCSSFLPYPLKSSLSLLPRSTEAFSCVMLSA